MHIAIYGGTFDPIHTGHIMIASYVARHCAVDMVWLMVSPENPWKRDRQMAPEADRLAMARLAVCDLPGVEVSDFEFTLPRPSFTYNTLCRLREAYPQHSFSIIIGGDNWRDFTAWHNADQILDEFGVIVYPRPGVILPPERSISTTQVTLLPPSAPQSEANSTAVRDALNHGQLPPVAMLHPAVAEYVRHHQLYGS